MTTSKYKSSRNVVYSCKYHVVWCSKYRRKVLTQAIQKDLAETIDDVYSEKSCAILAREMMLDHVHLLFEVDPQYGIHKLVKQIKGRSSYYLKRKIQAY